jgi:hypothetical protein
LSRPVRASGLALFALLAAEHLFLMLSCRKSRAGTARTGLRLGHRFAKALDLLVAVGKRRSGKHK